jgi:hypothetical protein
MQENILEKNLKFISKYNPELAKKIATHSNLQAEYRIEEAQSGDSILYKDNIALDDPTDPVWASIDELKKNKHKTKECINIVLGLGLGYVFKEAVKRQKGRIIIHEPNLDVLRITLELVDFSEELTKNNIFLTHTYDDIENSFYNVFIHNYPINICKSHYHSKTDGAYFNQFKSKINDIYGIFQSNYSNLFNKNKIWTTSVFNNIPEIIKHQDLHILSDKFKGKTSVIISAGPSLDKNIKDLLPYRENIVVFCVGTAFRTAIKNGIIPDFISVLEISQNTLTQLNLPELAKTNVIITNTTYNEVFKLNPKRFFNYYGNKTPASKWLGNVLNVPTEKYEESGTVSLTAFYSAVMLGFDKVIFIGQDLAYTNNQCYSKDSLYGSYQINESKTVQTESKDEIVKLLNTKTALVEQHMEILGKELIEIQGQNGTRVLTRPDMLLFIKYFEKAAEEYTPTIKMINATEGGAFLNGLEHITLKNALEKYAGKEKIKVESIIVNYQIKSEKIQKRTKLIHSKLSEMMKTYHQSYSIISNSLEKHVFPHFDSAIKEIMDFEVLDNSLLLYNANFYNCKVEELGDSRYRFKKEDSAKFVEMIEKCINQGLNAKFTEEEDFIRCKASKYIEIWKEKLHNNIEKNFKDNIEKFNNNLKSIKDDYLNISLLLENNAYLKNYHIKDFYDLNNKIRTFEGENDNLEENLVELSKMLNYFLVMSYLYWPENIKTVQKIIKRLS